MAAERISRKEEGGGREDRRDQERKRKKRKGREGGRGGKGSRGEERGGQGQGSIKKPRDTTAEW